MSGDDTSGPSPYRAIVSAETRSVRKQCAPAAVRNTRPILDVLADVVPAAGRALEIASGTGQHIAAFAAAFPGIHWQPSDPGAEARDSIAAWVADSGLANLAPPLDLDVTHGDWPAAGGGPWDIMVCINMIHIAPWAACLGLMDGAGTLLRPGGALYLYGPYRRDGGHTAPSNEAFDQSLRARNPEWGVRGMEDVAQIAAVRGLAWERTVPMPANNFSLVLRKTEG
ncbi:MAG: class I SAM-dependent methyltransferase [Alphaproteobacteria bacterium]|nr:class I SAM-dependent methyltransferase [Alphaproteobacteria bacterium]